MHHFFLSNLCNIADNSADGGLVVTSHVEGGTELGDLGQLIATALALHLAVQLKDLLNSSGSDGVTEGKESTTSVDGNTTIKVSSAAANELLGLAVLAESEGLVHEELGDGEAIVDLGNLEVGTLDASGLKSTASSNTAGGHASVVGGVKVEVSGGLGKGGDLGELGTSELLGSLLGDEDHGGSTVGDLRAIRDAEVGLVLLVGKEVGVLVGGDVGPLQGHLGGVHVGKGVLVTVGVGLDGDHGGILGGEVSGGGDVLHTAGKEAREGEVIDATLAGVVGGTGEVVTTLARGDGGLDLRSDGESDVGSGADGVVGNLDGKGTTGACTLDTHGGLVQEVGVSTDGSGTHVSLVDEELSSEVSDGNTVDVLSLDSGVLEGIVDSLGGELLNGGVLLLAEVGVTLVNEVGATLSDEGGEGSTGNEDLAVVKSGGGVAHHGLNYYKQ